MKNKTLWIVIIAIAVISLFGAITSLYLVVKPHKTGYIEITKLYNSFTYKKELESEYKNIEAKRKNILDSLRLNLDLFVKQNQNNSKNTEIIKKYEILKEQYQLKEQQFSEDNRALSDKYNQQIINQMNQYVQDFGKEYGYTYIFGANSNGTLMYAKDAENISDKVLEFINAKYQGKGSK
jgi:outer membrane protein